MKKRTVATLILSLLVCIKTAAILASQSNRRVHIQGGDAFDSYLQAAEALRKRQIYAPINNDEVCEDILIHPCFQACCSIF